MRCASFAFTVSIVMLTLLGLAIGSKYLGISLAFAAQRGVRLVQHESEAGKFRVKFPEKPDSDTKELSLGAGGQTLTVTTAKADGPNGSVFAVTFADYPESYRQVPIKTILDGVRDGLKGTDGKIDKYDEVFLGEAKVPGREVRITAGRRLIHARVYLHGSRLYQVMVTGTRERFPVDAVKAFFDSFELVK
ncbi:MAG TPA: hypothetical protein VFG68_02700 [Fimbriiglobus sp.]|nr:hypothetical protein [Fimbriiglobus sp.]